MKDIGVLIGLICGGATWYWLVRVTRAKGWWAAASHLAGAVMFIPVMVAGFVLVSEPGAASAVFSAMVAGIVYLLVRPWCGKQEVSPAPSDHVQREIDGLARLATNNRQSLTATDDDGKSWKDSAGKKPKSASGKRHDVVTFDYMNQQGEFSSRRVLVQWVGEWKFDGIDLEKEAERSFRYDAIIGDITSQETGEMQSPTAWRDSIRWPHPPAPG